MNSNYYNLRKSTLIKSEARKKFIKMTNENSPDVSAGNNGSVESKLIKAFTDALGKLETKQQSPLPSFEPNKNDFTEWIDMFEGLTLEVENKRVEKLPFVLKGDALKFYVGQIKNNGSNKLSWNQWRDVLTDEFGVKEFALAQAVSNRTQGADEDPISYCRDLMRKLETLMPDMPEITKVAFLMKGMEPSLAEKVALAEPKTCERILNRLQSLKSHQATKSSNQANTREIIDTLASAIKGHLSPVETMVMDVHEDRFNKIEKQLTVLTDQLSKLMSMNNNNDRGKQPVRQRPTCLYCKYYGHDIKDCRKRLADMKSQGNSNSGSQGAVNQK